MPVTPSTSIHGSTPDAKSEGRGGNKEEEGADDGEVQSYGRKTEARELVGRQRGQASVC